MVSEIANQETLSGGEAAWIKLGADTLQGCQMRAFVETGSCSRMVFGSLSESNLGGGLVKSAFFAQRSGPDGDGVLVTIVFSGDPPPNVEIWVTLFQNGAERYGSPQIFRGP